MRRSLPLMLLAAAATLSACATSEGQADSIPSDSIGPAVTATLAATTAATESGDAVTTSVATESTSASTSTSTTTTTTTTTPSTTQPAPTIPDDELATTDDEGVTEIRTVEPNNAPAVTANAEQCQPTWTQPPPKGTAEITFIVDQTLWSVTADGANPTCLAKLSGPVGVAMWKPTADQLLVDQITILDERGPRSNGLTANAGVEWSRPTGKALIVPSPDAKKLIHVETDDPTDITDIAALAQTWQAIYYPSGQSVIASGIDSNGVAGLFLASNLGEIRRPIATLDDPDSSITDMSMLSDGKGVMFIHDHRHREDGAAATGDEDGVLSHVHLLTLPDLTFQDLAALHHSVATDLVTAMDGSDQASFAADTSTVGSTTGIWYRFPNRFVTPAGMDAQGNTYAIVRSNPAAPGELWKLPTTGADVQPTLLTNNVTNAMVRLQQGDYTQLPDEIEAQAPG